MSITTAIGLVALLGIPYLLGWIRFRVFLAAWACLLGVFIVLAAVPASAQMEGETTTTTEPEPTTTTTTEPEPTTTTVLEPVGTLTPYQCLMAGYQAASATNGPPDFSMFSPDQQAEIIGMVMGDPTGARPTRDCSMMMGFGYTFAGVQQNRTSEAASSEAIVSAIEAIDTGSPPTSSTAEAPSGVASGGIDWDQLSRGFVLLVFLLGAAALGLRWLFASERLTSEATS